MRLLETDPLEIDQPWVSRLLLGALSEHEQRLLAVRLLHRDPVTRQVIAVHLEPIGSPDLDLMREYDTLLEEGEGGEEEIGSGRRRLLSRAIVRVGKLDQILRELTYGNVFELRTVADQFFSWTTAEHLLQRAERQREKGESSARQRDVSLYLALSAIDGVEILGAAGRIPEMPAVVRDVRRRLWRSAEERSGDPRSADFLSTDESRGEEG